MSGITSQEQTNVVCAYPSNLRVKNTFLEIPMSPSRMLRSNKSWPLSQEDYEQATYVSCPQTEEKPECKEAAQCAKALSSGSTAVTRASGSQDASSSPRRTTDSASESSAFKQRSTIMLRNIPRKCTQKALLSELDEAGFLAKYDFVYLPFCFETKANVGYTFINFIDDATAESFLPLWNKTKLATMSGKRPLTASYADVQGLEANIQRLAADYKIARINNPRYQPAVFENGVRVNFQQFTVKANNSNASPRVSQRPVEPTLEVYASRPHCVEEPWVIGSPATNSWVGTPSSQCTYMLYPVQQTNQVY